MPERRYSEDEVAAIFAAASEDPQTRQLPAPTGEGLTLADLQAIGREVGISQEAVSQAARSLESVARPPQPTFLGLPIGVERTVDLHRSLTEQEWERLVVELREVFHAKGTVRSSGSLREWTNGNLHALLEPTADGHRLRLRTIKGNARASMAAGLGMIGISAALAAATALGGHVGAAFPGIAFLGLAGLGMIANGALRLPSWARLRARQMESIGPKWALAPTPPSIEPPNLNNDKLS